MKAIRIHNFGPTEEVLQYEDIPAPQPAANELLIKVEAAALNRADLGLRKGTYRVAPEDLPIIPGREFAGTVTEVGAGVQEFKTGQRVVAYPGRGGYAQFAVAKAADCRPLPSGIEPATAAAMPTVFLTAWFALQEDGKLKPGEWALIQAGSSGVGTAAIQIAKHKGAKVITTTGSDDKAKRLGALGPDEVVNYVARDFKNEVSRITGNRGVDVVLEMVGGDVYAKSLETLAAGGRLVSIGGAFGPIPDPPPRLPDGRKASRFSITNYLKSHPEGFQEMDRLMTLVREKKFQVIIDKTFPLAETRAAQKYLAGREHFGKVVLVP
jgi:NADPH:quinone reductase